MKLLTTPPCFHLREQVVSCPTGLYSVVSKYFNIVIWNKVIKSLWTQHSSVTCPTYLHHSSYHSSCFILFLELPSLVDHSSTSTINNPLGFTETGFIPISKPSFESILLFNPPLTMKDIKAGIFCPTDNCHLLYTKLCSWLFTRYKYSQDSVILRSPYFELLIYQIHFYQYRWLVPPPRQTLSDRMLSCWKYLVTKDKAIIKASL